MRLHRYYWYYDTCSGDPDEENCDTTEEGAVEICLNGEWDFVGDEGWDAADARVVCRQLELPTECKSRDIWLAKL